jgi:hypothetical protein
MLANAAKSSISNLVMCISPTCHDRESMRLVAIPVKPPGLCIAACHWPIQGVKDKS